MASKGTDPNAYSSPRHERGSLGRALLRIASQIFGGSVVTTESKVSGQGGSSQSGAPAGQTPVEAAKSLERTLEHVESMLKSLEEQVQSANQAKPGSELSSSEDVADLKETIRDTFERLEGTLQRLATQAERLADGASDLAKIAGGVEARMEEATRAMRDALGHEAVSPPKATNGEGLLEPEEVAPPPEPVFQPQTYPLALDLAAVAGFQQLMDVQRALDTMDEADGASVVAFRNGVASLEVALHAPVTARKVVDGLRAATAETVIIEESRPEAHKLRLRIVEGGALA